LLEVAPGLEAEAADDLWVLESTAALPSCGVYCSERWWREEGK